MRRAVMLYRSCVIACVTALAGCVPLRSATDSASTVLLEVRLNGEHTPARPVIGLMVSIGAEQGLERQFAFAPQERISREYTDFRVRVKLSAGRYQLRRISAITRGGAVVPQWDIDVAMAFELRPRATKNLGHMEIGSAASTDPDDARS